MTTTEIDPDKVATDWDRNRFLVTSLKIKKCVFSAPSISKYSIKVGWIIIFKGYNLYYFFWEFDMYFSQIGLIMDNGTCISLENCPCSFHGLAYSVGSKIEQECTEWYVIQCTANYFWVPASWQLYYDICLKEYADYWFSSKNFPNIVCILFKVCTGVERASLFSFLM